MREAGLPGAVVSGGVQGDEVLEGLAVVETHAVREAEVAGDLLGGDRDGTEEPGLVSPGDDLGVELVAQQGDGVLRRTGRGGHGPPRVGGGCGRVRETAWLSGSSEEVRVNARLGQRTLGRSR